MTETELSEVLTQIERQRLELGKHFYSEVKKDKFPNIRYTGKVDKYGTAIYEVYFENGGEKPV